MIAFIAAGVLVVALALTVVRLFAGPTLYDRVLAANAAVCKVALVVAAVAAATGGPALVDVAMVLLLGSFVLNAAILKFFRARSFQAPLVRAGEDLA
ncbi:other cation transporters [alpha proteobacterium U9-1i]|nr:other cation transporters [alpha proteobacterium U9-1i]